MQAVGYVRVSTEGQATEGVSLEAQEARIRTWCEGNGYTLSAVHVDAGLSGSKATNRPGLQAALTQACGSRAALVVASLSRLARSTKDTLGIAERLEKAGADLVSLSERIDTTNAAGKMVFRMLAVLAEFERDQVSERTKAALQHKKTKGERVGTLPFGYHLAADGISLEENGEEQRTLHALLRFRGEGHSFRKTADLLNQKGFRTRRGTPWRFQYVAALAR